MKPFSKKCHFYLSPIFLGKTRCLQILYYSWTFNMKPFAALINKLESWSLLVTFTSLIFAGKATCLQIEYSLIDTCNLKTFTAIINK
jgi:hypothetical protein